MITTDPAAQAERMDYGELSAAELAKLINDEYGLVLASERSNLQRARAIGEKLEALRVGTPHGEWQKKLKKWCPKISYETANRYIKLYEKWPAIEKAAAVKNVVTTDLTLDAALKLLSKSKADPNKDKDDEGRKSVSATLGAVEPPLSDEDEEAAWLRNLAVDELIILLREVCGTEYLRELHAALGKVLTPSTTAVATTASVGTGTSTGRVCDGLSLRARAI
jgi:DUF3102 family protein